MALSFEGFSEINKQRCEAAFHPIDSWSPTDWACAMAGEVGEACNLVKKLRRGEDIPATEIGKELADVVTYADLLATRLGLSLGECVRLKFNEVSIRRCVEHCISDLGHASTSTAERDICKGCGDDFDKPGPCEDCTKENI